MGLVIVDTKNGWNRDRDGNTVHTQEDIIRFVHYTAQEFFEKNRCQKYPDGHHKITESCLSILAFSDFDIEPCLRYTRRERKIKDKAKHLLSCLRDSIPVVRYASQYWGKHGRLALEATLSLSLQAATRRFLRKPTNLAFSTWNLPCDVYGDHHPLMSPLHLLAYFGIPSVEEIAFRILQGVGVDLRYSFDQPPLHMYCRSGHFKVMKMLLKRGADKNAQTRPKHTPLYYAIEHHHKEAIKLLWILV